MFTVVTVKDGVTSVHVFFGTTVVNPSSTLTTMNMDSSRKGTALPSLLEDEVP